LDDGIQSLAFLDSVKGTLSAQSIGVVTIHRDQNTTMTNELSFPPPPPPPPPPLPFFIYLIFFFYKLHFPFSIINLFETLYSPISSK